MDKQMKQMKAFHEANKHKECEICGTGVEIALFEIHQISDGKYVSDGNTLTLCNRCIETLFDGKEKYSFIDLFNFWLGNYELPNKPEILNALIDQFEKETGKSIFKNEIKEGFDVITTVCDKCGETLNLEIDSGFAKIPFESSWSCKCGNFIRTKWNGKELEYI